MPQANEEFYEGVRGLACLVVFVGVWVYAVAQYGLLLGVGFGWLPAMILTAIVAVLWPIVFVLLGLAVVAVGLLLLWVLVLGG